MRATYLTAAVMTVLLVLWMVSGSNKDDDNNAPPSSIEAANERMNAVAEDREPSRVRARIVEAQTYTRNLVVRGRTENKRTVIVKAETAGRIAQRPVEKGDRVEAGALLCQINTDGRDATVNEANEALNQARIDHEGALKLKAQGLVSASNIAATKARLASAEANLERARVELARVSIRAPFAGMIEDIHAEAGAFVGPGGDCATIVALDPMLLVGSVAEKGVAALTPGSTTMGLLADGREVTGTLTFIGQQSDAETRTYPIEIEIPNADYALRSGITAEIRLPVGNVAAHKISPALLALDDAGDTGIRLLDEDNRVVFQRVDILAQERDGIWLSGLPERATIITVGQEMVVPGEIVDPVFESAGEMPAKASDDKEKDSAGARHSRSVEAEISAIGSTVMQPLRLV
jgi:multidrug efflux system membrane fusion protein